MKQQQAMLPALVAAAVVGAVLFVFGGALTTQEAGTRIALAISAVAIIAFGTVAVILARQRSRLIGEIQTLEAAAAEMRLSDAGLRARMTYTLRDPLTSIVGFADRMVEDQELSTDIRRDMLVEIRNSAREVERVLADLAVEDDFLHVDLRTEGVVFLDEELQSIASTIPSGTAFEIDLAPARAWGESAQVRQIMRTILSSARENGCTQMTLKTETRRGRAVATISSRSDLIPPEAVAALTGNTTASDATSDSYLKLRAASDAAKQMDGSIGYAQAMGKSHIMIDLKAAPTDVGIQQSMPVVPPKRKPPDTGSQRGGGQDISFMATVGNRPHPPLTAIRFH